MPESGKASTVLTVRTPESTEHKNDSSDICANSANYLKGLEDDLHESLRNNTKSGNFEFGTVQKCVNLVDLGEC